MLRRGFKKVKSSHTRKLVQAFESEPRSQTIFEVLSRKPILRVLTHLLYDSWIIDSHAYTKDEIHNFLRKYEQSAIRALGKSPDRNLLCQKCSEVINCYNVYEQKKPSWTMKCPKCHFSNLLSRCLDEDDWFPFESVTSYLDELTASGIIKLRNLATCTRCSKSDYFKPLSMEELKLYDKEKLLKYVQTLYCKNCGRPYDLQETYSPEDHVLALWSKDRGVWLEWYVKNIVKQAYPNTPIEQGLIVEDDGAVQIDTLLLEDGRLTAFECKAIHPRKRARFNEVSDVLKLLDFSDEVFLVITTKMNKNEKKLLQRQGGRKLSLVESLDVEHFLSI